MRVNNLGFAAYLILNGFKLESPPGRDKDFIFEFNLTQEKHNILFSEYTGSSFSRFDNIVTNLKKSIPRYSK